MEFETKAIHVGQEPDPTTGAVVVPIYATSTYAQSGPGEHSGYEYSRTANPTRSALGSALAALEGVDAVSGGGAIITSSGMAAMSLIGELLRPGAHVIIPNDAYGGSYRLVARVWAGRGITFDAVDQTDVGAVAAAIRPETGLLWIETPTNPLLRVVDIAALCAIAREAGVLSAVDNTFATPYLQRPLELGADIVAHSATKYLGGHSDVVGGALVITDPDLLERLRFLENAIGPVAGPFDAFLVQRGLKTLALRMGAHSANAAAVASFLEGHGSVLEVTYPGLASHPQHALASRQMAAFGGMVSFRPRGGVDAARRIVTSTKLFFLAESLGGVESLIELPGAMTHLSVSGTSLEVPDDLVRLSVGIEAVSDLLADLDHALAG
jgi:cystathionine gamma-synthase